MGPLRIAIKRLSERKRLLGAVLGLHVAVALLGGAHLGATLGPLTDGRPAAARMLAGDDALLGELLADHPEILQAASTSTETSVLLYGLLSWILAGGLLAALIGECKSIETKTPQNETADNQNPPAEYPNATPENQIEVVARGAPEILAACARHASRMVRVGAAGLILRLIPIGVGVGAWFAIRPWWRDRGFHHALLGLGLTALLAGAAWSFASVAVDYARGLAFRDGALGAWRALGRGLKLALRRRGPTLRLILFSGFGFIAITIIYLAIALRVPSGAAWAPLALALLRVAAAAGRAFVTIATLTAAARVATE